MPSTTALLRTVRTTSDDPAFRALVAQLDRDLAERNGEANAFFSRFNGIAHLGHVVVVMAADVPAGCGAFKPFGNDAVEIKRMYTTPALRKRGVASLILKDLKDLEQRARELGHRRCVLETGRAMQEAVALYRKHGYASIPNYGPYEGVESSVCFANVIG